MLIALIVLSVLNVVLTFVVFCGQRALWARLPDPVVQNFTVGDVATAEQVRKSVKRAQTYGSEAGPEFFGTVRGKQAHRPESPPSEPEPV